MDRSGGLIDFSLRVARRSFVAHCAGYVAKREFKGQDPRLIMTEVLMALIDRICQEVVLNTRRACGPVPGLTGVSTDARVGMLRQAQQSHRVVSYFTSIITPPSHDENRVKRQNKTPHGCGHLAWLALPKVFAEVDFFFFLDDVLLFHLLCLAAWSNGRNPMVSWWSSLIPLIEGQSGEQNSVNLTRREYDANTFGPLFR